MNSVMERDSKFSPQNLLFILLTLQFVIAPFYYQPNFGGEGLYLPYNSSVWMVAVWIIAVAAVVLSRKHALILPRYWFGMALLPLGAVATGFIVETANPTEWLTRLCVITGGYLFFISLFQFRLSPKQIDQSLYILLSMGMVASAYSIFQIHNLEDNFSFIPRVTNDRPVGIFQQVNIQASFMATLIALVFYLVSRPSLTSMNWLIKIALGLTAFAASYTIAASGSRVGLLGATLAVFLLLIGRWRLFRIHKKTFLFILICTVAGTSLQLSGLQKSSAKFDSALGGMDAEVRWKVYTISWNTFLESPVLGHGLGSFQSVFQEKRKEYQQEDILHLGSSPRFSHPHNELMFWLVEGGVISVAGILIAAIVTFIQLIKLGWQRGTAYAALLIPITLHTQVELPFYTANTHWLVLLFLLFITHQHRKKTIATTGLSLAMNRLIPLTFIGIATFSCWTLTKTLTANSKLVEYYTGRNTQPELLNAPINSFYFRDYALFLSHRHKMVEGLKNRDAEPLVEFINYTEKLLSISPGENYYIELVNAYSILGEKELRDKRLEEGLDTYEASPRLLYLKQKIESNEKKEKAQSSEQD